MKYSLLVLSMIVLGGVGCAPKVYVLDRQTILQAEATGRFPKLEDTFLARGLQPGPKMLDRTQLKTKAQPEKAHQILNGELTHETKK
jgi:hypothetical protein